MTSGANGGTRGKPAFRLGPWGLIALITIPMVIVNATSVMMEHSHIHPAEPFLWEISSSAVLLLLAPLVGMAARRWRLEGPGVWASVAVHAALVVPFSVVHILGMFLIRSSAYAIFGGDYDFFSDGVGRTFLYEGRKDAISYAIFLAVFSAAAHFSDRKAAADATLPERIEVRDGGKTVYLAPADLLFLEAAGNYVEIHTATGMHLVRGTLAAWEQKLAGQGFVRIHRSRLVNRVHVSALKPTGSGDFELTLTGGRVLQGSRRFRAGLA